MASCFLLSAAVARLYLPLYDFQPVPRWLVFITVVSIVFGCLINDWRTLGRPHIVTVTGGEVLLSKFLLADTIIGSELWHGIADKLLRIADRPSINRR